MPKHQENLCWPESVAPLQAEILFDDLQKLFAELYEVEEHTSKLELDYYKNYIQRKNMTWEDFWGSDYYVTMWDTEDQQQLDYLQEEIILPREHVQTTVGLKCELILFMLVVDLEDYLNECMFYIDKSAFECMHSKDILSRFIILNAISNNSGVCVSDIESKLKNLSRWRNNFAHGSITLLNRNSIKRKEKKHEKWKVIKSSNSAHVPNLWTFFEEFSKKLTEYSDVVEYISSIMNSHTNRDCNIKNPTHYCLRCDLSLYFADYEKARRKYEDITSRCNWLVLSELWTPEKYKWVHKRLE